MMWICLSKNNKEPRALFYSYDLGKHRVYRNNYPVPNDKAFRLFAYKRKGNAQQLCDVINEAYQDDFEPVEVEDYVINDVKEYAKNGFICGIDIGNNKDQLCMTLAYKEGKHE